MDYTHVNSLAIDKWVAEGWEWGEPISAEAYAAAAQGQWGVLLTPLKAVPKEWFAPWFNEGRLDGCRLLGLASGGGQQMPIFSAAGADCVVFDNSAAQLESERMVAAREGYKIEIIQGDMTKTLPFADNEFDIIFHPVSNCYVEDISHIWRECWRVLKPGGVLLSGMCKDFVYLFDEENSLEIARKLPYNPLKDPELYAKAVAEDWGIQFSHGLEEQIGGQLRAGFTLADIYEDTDNLGGIGDYLPVFLATLAVKK